ncbi:MAG: acyl-CoA thioesterase [Candidatus Eisenbacteria bacterium]|uniref:Acyl-CoA thioesterase n=1 Tax=Eiseniibacteriota bacterium TaxID=2212470 RepID=A0A7Y2E5T6_UNCEI|nr:acyl-CoA thioesterase [Candidatus Eisenbacteria bacterium]
MQNRPEPYPERVRLEGNKVTTTIRVRYGETDKMGFAYYANYLLWFEVMRGDFMRAVGLPYQAMEEKEGLYLPISESHVRYLAPARYDDVLDISAWISQLKSRAIRFEYEIHIAGQLIATGYTSHVPIDLEGKPKRFSRELLDSLGVFLKTSSSD